MPSSYNVYGKLQEVQENVSGLRIQVTVRDENGIVDLSSASSLYLVLQKPDGTTGSLPASLLTNGKDGIMYCTTGSSTFDQDGTWYLQSSLRNGLLSGKSSVIAFTVNPNLA